MRERTETCVSGSYLHTVLKTELLIKKHSLHAVEDRHRIVEHAERIDTDIKAEILQLDTDVLTEAASKHHYLIAVGDACPASFICHRSLKS